VSLVRLSVTKSLYVKVLTIEIGIIQNFACLLVANMVFDWLIA
jgi:hypothetical protein